MQEKNFAIKTDAWEKRRKGLPIDAENAVKKHRESHCQHILVNLTISLFSVT